MPLNFVKEFFMRMIAFSDTHHKHRQVTPLEGEILIFAGDLCSRGSLIEVEDFALFLKELDFKHKIVIAGNHDFPFENHDREASEQLIKDTGAYYLNNSGIEIEGISIWGSPVQPEFMNFAFNRKRGNDIKKYWDLIPHDLDVLITHCPPFEILDRTVDGVNAGCEELLKRVEIVHPKIHIFGHIHEGFGSVKKDQTRFFNVACLDEKYHLKNQVTIIDI